MLYPPSWSYLHVRNVRKLFLYFEQIWIFQMTCFRVKFCSFFFYISLNFNSSSLFMRFTHFQNISVNRILSFNFDGQSKLSDLLSQDKFPDSSFDVARTLDNKCSAVLSSVWFLIFHSDCKLLRSQTIFLFWFYEPVYFQPQWLPM